MVRNRYKESPDQEHIEIGLLLEYNTVWSFLYQLLFNTKSKLLICQKGAVVGHIVILLQIYVFLLLYWVDHSLFIFMFVEG
jgi:hypothetical protein